MFLNERYEEKKSHLYGGGVNIHKLLKYQIKTF